MVAITRSGALSYERMKESARALSVIPTTMLLGVSFTIYTLSSSFYIVYMNTQYQ
jgi:hypothetical protein